MADLKVYLDGPAATSGAGAEPGGGAGCGQDGAPPGARVVPSVLIRADTLDYRDTSPAAERARSNHAQPPHANPSNPPASMAPAQPELKAKVRGCLYEMGS